MVFVVAVIGGLGSVRGAFLAALPAGLTDTMSRAMLPTGMQDFLPPDAAAQVAASLGSVAVSLLVAVVVAVRPRGRALLTNPRRLTLDEAMEGGSRRGCVATSGRCRRG